AAITRRDRATPGADHVQSRNAGRLCSKRCTARYRRIRGEHGAIGSRGDNASRRASGNATALRSSPPTVRRCHRALQPICSPPAPVFGPPLGPDQRITPVPPLPTSPYPTDSFTPMLTDPAVDMDVVLSEAQTGRLMLGVAVNSDAGLVGQILLDEQSFDITRPPTSWDDFWSGRAFRGGGERLRIEAAPGTQVQRYLISFQEPYVFNTPYSLGL